MRFAQSKSGHLSVLLLTIVLCWTTLALPANAGTVSIRGPPIIDDEGLTSVARRFFSFRDDEKSEAISVEKRGGHLKDCTSDYQCPSNRYCSSKRHKCFKKLRLRHKCSRDYACRTGYCGRRSHRCAKRKSEGRKCFGSDVACQSSYCDSSSNICAAKNPEGGKCHEDSGCETGFCLASGKCGKKSTPVDPNPPQPSGHARRK